MSVIRINRPDEMQWNPGHSRYAAHCSPDSA